VNDTQVERYVGVNGERKKKVTKMIEKGRISGLQMVLIMHPTIMVTGLILMPWITAVYAKQDMWLSPIFGSIIGYVNVFLVNKLNQIYPKETIIEYSKHIIGVIPGKIIGFIFLFFYLHLNGMIIREYGELIKTSFLAKTPILVIIGSMVVLCSFAVRGGLEVIARCAEFVNYFIYIFLLLLIMMLIPELKIKNLFPVMEHGIIPSIKGAFVTTLFFSEFILITFLLPFLNDQKNGVKWGLYAVHLTIFTFVLFNIVPVLLFGGITDTVSFPMISAIEYISIAKFFEHLEAIGIVFFVGGVFIKISMFYYAVTLGTAQWLNLSEYRPIVFPIGSLLVLFSIWSATSLQDLAYFLATSSAFYMLSVQTILPLLLLMIALIRKKMNKPK
jgi:spore germination protein KB